MSARVSLHARVEQYLAERRRVGFELSTMGHGLASFARHVQAAGHRGPLTVDLMAAWARQAKGGHGDRATSARRPPTRCWSSSRRCDYEKGTSASNPLSTR
jgi:hypothetical protein